MAEEAAQEEEEEEEVEEEQVRIYSAVHTILSIVFDISSMLWFSSIQFNTIQFISKHTQLKSNNTNTNNK